MDSDIAIGMGFSGYSLLFHKVDTSTYYPGHTVPVVRLKIVRSDHLPLDAESFSALPYLSIASGRQYRLELANTSKRTTPKQMQYAGCFTPIPELPGEWLCTNEAGYWGALWKYFDKLVLNRIRCHNDLNRLLK